MPSRKRTKRYSSVEWARIPAQHKAQLRLNGLAPEADEQAWLSEKAFAEHRLRELDDDQDPSATPEPWPDSFAVAKRRRKLDDSV